MVKHKYYVAYVYSEGDRLAFSCVNPYLTDSPLVHEAQIAQLQVEIETQRKHASGTVQILNFQLLSSSHSHDSAELMQKGVALQEHEKKVNAKLGAVAACLNALQPKNKREREIVAAIRGALK